MEETEIKRQLWTPKIENCLRPLWILPVHRSEDGEFVTYRCEDQETGRVFNMAHGPLTQYYQPTEEYELIE